MLVDEEEWGDAAAMADATMAPGDGENRRGWHRTHVISMAADFSPTPAGRVDADGDHNATRFREKLLVPALERGGITVVDLGGVAWCAASFVEEAFAPLVTKHNYDAAVLHDVLRIEPGPAGEHQETAAMAFDYIDRAQAG